ncbi:MAG: GDSL-type esterase/lipase family protein [Chloroflexota bacterium]
MKASQNPVIPLLVGGLLVVALVAVFSIVAWVWAVRRPTSTEAGQAMQPAPTQLPPIVYAAIGASDVVGIGADDPATQSWVNVLQSKMPPDTRLVRLGRSGITLSEANKVEVAAAVQAQPDIVTMWNCVNDATRGVSLSAYIKELNQALTRLVKESKATVVLLNMPDISVQMLGSPDAQKALVRGGILQWNQAMSAAAASYGNRVHIVDLFTVSEEVVEHPEYISPDNFHPSTVGYARLADVVWQMIEDQRLLDR